MQQLAQDTGFESLDEIAQWWKPREFIMLIGPPKTGKSYGVLSVAQYLSLSSPDAKCYILDTENGILKIAMNDPKFRGLTNLRYMFCPDMNKFIAAFQKVSKLIQPQDWICVESLARVWELAQDVGYEYVTGIGKAEYLSERLTVAHGQKASGPVTPSPDNLWQIVKNGYNRNFMDKLTDFPGNILVTSTTRGQRQRESASRREARTSYLGSDVWPDGAPRDPAYPDTVILTSKGEGGFKAAILGDRGYEDPGTAVSFDVNNIVMDLAANRQLTTVTQAVMREVK